MAVETTDTLVVGAGQSGIAMSEHLSALKIPHIVLERSRIAENWSSMRWDSLVANGPAWHDRFPNLTFEDVHPDAFPGKDRVARYFNDYAAMIEATGMPVTTVTKRIGEGHPNVVDVVADGTVQAVVNTLSGDTSVLRDGFYIRRAAVERRIPCFTSLDTARAAVESLLAEDGSYSIQTIDEYLAGS